MQWNKSKAWLTFIFNRKKKIVQTVTVPFEIGCLHLVTQIWSSGMPRAVITFVHHSSPGHSSSSHVLPTHQLKFTFSRSIPKHKLELAHVTWFSVSLVLLNQKRSSSWNVLTDLNPFSSDVTEKLHIHVRNHTGYLVWLPIHWNTFLYSPFVWTSPASKRCTIFQSICWKERTEEVLFLLLLQRDPNTVVLTI